MKVHLVNAGKYSTSLFVALAAIWLIKSSDSSSLMGKEVNEAFWVYLVIKFI